MYSTCTYTQTPTHATHSHGHTHAHIHARTSYRDDQVFTMACDDRNPGRTCTTPIRSAFASLLSQAWFLAQSGFWHLVTGLKKTYVTYFKKPCGSAAVSFDLDLFFVAASKLGILGIPRGSIEDVLQRLRAGLQSAHVGMAGLPDGLRFGQGWARCPTSRLGVGEQLIDGLVGGLEHEFYDFSIYIGNFIIPTDELIFFRGVETPTTNQ